MFSKKEIVKHLKEMRHYIIFSTVIFLAGLVFGATSSGLHDYINSQIDSLRKVAQTIQSSDNPTLGFIGFIFLNNAIKAILVMYLGIFLGVVPLFFLSINGMVIGYIIGLEAENGGGNLFDLIVKGLLPHGILEIPAILVACAYGLRFGALMFQGAGALVLKREGWGAKFERLMVRSVPMMVILTITLFIAAIIESTITPWLLSM